MVDANVGECEQDGFKLDRGLGNWRGQISHTYHLEIVVWDNYQYISSFGIYFTILLFNAVLFILSK